MTINLLTFRLRDAKFSCMGFCTMFASAATLVFLLLLQTSLSLRCYVCVPNEVLREPFLSPGKSGEPEKSGKIMDSFLQNCTFTYSDGALPKTYECIYRHPVCVAMYGTTNGKEWSALYCNSLEKISKDNSSYAASCSTYTLGSLGQVLSCYCTQDLCNLPRSIKASKESKHCKVKPTFLTTLVMLVVAIYTL